MESLFGLECPPKELTDYMTIESLVSLVQSSTLLRDKIEEIAFKTGLWLELYLEIFSIEGKSLISEIVSNPKYPFKVTTVEGSLFWKSMCIKMVNRYRMFERCTYPFEIAICWEIGMYPVEIEGIVRRFVRNPQFNQNTLKEIIPHYCPGGPARVISVEQRKIRARCNAEDESTIRQCAIGIIGLAIKYNNLEAATIIRESLNWRLHARTVNLMDLYNKAKQDPEWRPLLRSTLSVGGHESNPELMSALVSDNEVSLARALINDSQTKESIKENLPMTTEMLKMLLTSRGFLSEVTYSILSKLVSVTWCTKSHLETATNYVMSLNLSAPRLRNVLNEAIEKVKSKELYDYLYSQGARVQSIEKCMISSAMSDTPQSKEYLSILLNSYPADEELSRKLLRAAVEAQCVETVKLLLGSDKVSIIHIDPTLLYQIVDEEGSKLNQIGILLVKDSRLIISSLKATLLNIILDSPSLKKAANIT